MILVRWLFLRALGLIYAFAFISLSSQIVGLIGKEGISPIAPVMEALKLSYGLMAIPEFPTIAWFNCSDQFLQAMCIAGALSSLLVVLGVLTGPALFICWILWLSLVSIGQDFLRFQWDALLLEAGFLSIFFAPWGIAEPPWRWNNFKAGFTPYSPAFIWLYRWLLFRLMFESGIVKIGSGDPTWANFTALNYHYLTQPLPTPLAYFMAKLPEWLHRLGVGITFLVEIIVPFFILLPRIFRLSAFTAFAFLQILILLTGNYAYFNLLTLALCLFLIDDKILRKVIALLKPAPAIVQQLVDSSTRQLKLTMKEKIPTAFTAAVIIVLTFTNFFHLGALARNLQPLVTLACQCCIFNQYGLFAIMTTSRKEIVIEGSNDRKEWRPYEFRYKPGDLSKIPCMVAPMQPRLDWQMWFAALGTWEQSPWFLNFIVRLFENSPSVVGLLEQNPFPDSPPRYLRAQVYSYYFSDLSTLIKTGRWWRREYAGDFLPEMHVK